ncbi:WXG100 family type VII secretion target [Actinophytocola xanthii]|nr:WXG100 family type VII secretion target [Actinophytocola xanthii]
MPEGFEYDPEAIRAFAEVFNQASKQVEQIRATVGETSATTADFGNSWQQRGTDFESHMAAIAQDLGNLATHLGQVGAQLTQGTDLIVQADTTGLRNIKAIGDGSGGAV